MGKAKNVKIKTKSSTMVIPSDIWKKALELLVDEETAKEWFQKRSLELGKTPEKALKDGEEKDVRMLLDQLESGGYV